MCTHITYNWLKHTKAGGISYLDACVLVCKYRAMTAVATVASHCLLLSAHMAYEWHLFA